MKRTTSIITTIVFILILVINSGCKRWLDVNQDPTIARDVPSNMLLSSAEISIASGIGTYLQVNGDIWAEHWTQGPSSSQYKIYEQYSPNASDYDRPWGTFYNDALMDLEAMQQKAAVTNSRDYIAIALLLKAYSFQVLTDGWGDIPFTEALKGRPQDGGIVNPKYDAQEVVYNGIISMIDSARNIIDALTSANIEGDLIYGGDMDLWRKFANTLELKVYLRLSEVNSGKASAGVAKVYSFAGGQAGFIDEGEDALINFSTSSGNQNPLFSEIVGLGRTQNLVASRVVVDSMLNNNDWRVYLLFGLTAGGTLVNVQGIPQGAYTLPASTPATPPSYLTGARANDPDDENAAGAAPVRLISDYESLFLQAEAAARGWGGSDPQDLFEQGIFASFRTYSSVIESLNYTLRDSFDGAPITTATTFNLTADYAAYSYINGDTVTGYVGGEAVSQAPPSYWGQYPAAGTPQEQVRHIITQKWFAMTGTQGFEAWTERRRTGYPDFFEISANTIIGQKYPTRFLYPNTELTRNSKFPGQKFVTERVWWDVN